MRAPHWREWEPPLDFARTLPLVLRAKAFALRYAIIAAELRAIGIDGNCTPSLDVARAETHPFLRNRCTDEEAVAVATIGKAVLEAQLDQGVLGVIKHMPGHGRAVLDSHLELPRVSAERADVESDFSPFRVLRDAPLGMTAHIIFDALDSSLPATQSETVLRFVREDLGFDGLLMTDDISMEALSGDVVERSHRSLAAGCDVILHSNGQSEEIAALTDALPRLEGAALRRADAALAARRPVTPVAAEILERELEALLREVAHA
jgi:beta-N-acetylhexosaminidase